MSPPAAVAVPAPVTMEPAETARQAGLRIVSDENPGIRRLRAGKGFRYLGVEGEKIRAKETLRRIRVAGHSAGLDERLDLSPGERPHPGRRPG